MFKSAEHEDGGNISANASVTKRMAFIEGELERLTLQQNRVVQDSDGGSSNSESSAEGPARRSIMLNKFIDAAVDNQRSNVLQFRRNITSSSIAELVHFVKVSF